MTIREFAPAKLNLYLHVLGRDQRGYHLLDSLVAFADIGDELTIAPAEAFSLAIDGPFGGGLESDSGNLAWQAAHALGQAAGRPPHVRIVLTKHLPIASGIGGGSSDAAAVLRGLCALWSLDPASAMVMDTARRLGADVPVCVAARPCFMGGIGEMLDPCPPLPRVPIVLANPGFPLPTRDVFMARHGPFAPEGRFDIAPRDAPDLARILAARENSLTTPAISLQPAIAGVLSALGQSEGCLIARMLGSGATCLGLFAGAEQARVAQIQVGERHPAWWVRAGHCGT